MFTSEKNKEKINFFKKLGLRVIFLKRLTAKSDFKELFKIVNKLGYSRILVESGLVFLNTLLKNKLIYNIFVFKSSNYLSNNGSNNTTNFYIKRLKLNNKIKVNLDNDNLYKVKIKDV